MQVRRFLLLASSISELQNWAFFKILQTTFYCRLKCFTTGFVQLQVFSSAAILHFKWAFLFFSFYLAAFFKKLA